MADVELTLSETLSLSEDLESGDLSVLVRDGSTLRVSFPSELSFTGVSDAGRYALRSATSANVNFSRVETNFDVLQTGTAFRVVDLQWAEYYPTTPDPNDIILGRPGLSSNILDVNGASFTSDNVGDFIHITNGVSIGTYQILSVYTSNEDVASMVVPHVPRIMLDRPLIVNDPANGYVQGVVEVVQVGPNPILRFPGVAITNPLVQLLGLQNRTQQAALDLLTLATHPSNVVYVDHNTFQIVEGGPISFPVSANDRIFAQGHVEPELHWTHTSGVKSVLLQTDSKFTANGEYLLTGRGLTTKSAEAYSFSVSFDVPSNVVPRPQVLNVTFLSTDGTVLVTYDQEMRVEDTTLTNPDDYTITGPTTVIIKRVRSLNATTVALETAGMGDGNYTLTVSTSTPKDIAGNPVDPLFNTVIFTASVPETTRSIFTDQGPIAKPAETLQTGVNAVLGTYNEVIFTGATLTSGLVGQYATISGGALNGGTFRIAAILSTTRARLANASFTLPDPDSGTLTWEIFDPRNGQIADDPADVVVRVNSIPVTPEAVVGLLGQIVLATAPTPTDDVQVDYSWCCNPVVEMRRLNSRELRLNAWNRDIGLPRDNSQHKYRYNNVLIKPGDYEPLNVLASLDQPLSRELHYRAYERAYTAVLNDPSLLLLNSPIHRVAFPPAERQLSEIFVNYEGVGLPDALLVNAWTRFGNGSASSSSGFLTVTDNTTGSFPTGGGIYWTKAIDLTFDHVFAMSWRFSLTTVTTLEGIFTGVAAGYSDERTAVVIGYLDDGGTKKFGVLRKGFGDDPSTLAAWTGGLDLSLGATDEPATLDWSILHSFRIYRDKNGTIAVFVDGDTVPVLQVVAADLPSLEEVNAAFDNIQGVFFGSLSRPGRTTSSWDFVRYLIQPTNPKQASSSSFVNYEATVIPEIDSKPWTPVGHHGDETILSGDFLLLDSTSATDTTTAADVGLVGGDYRGYIRFEPLFSRASEFVVDVDTQLITYTHGPSPNGLTVAVDDSNRLMQVAFFPSQATPKLSYGGRSLPEDFSPYVWSAMGGETSEMVGRVLRISDTVLLDGKVYFIQDLEPVTSDDRVVGGAFDYILECRAKVVSYTVDGAGFAGAFAQVYDSTRAVGLLLREVAGIKYVALHSDGTVISAFAFDWGDGDFHTYRLSKHTGGDLVTLFVDGAFVGTEAYSNFTVPAADPIGMVSFGSSTVLSSSAISVVDWAYCNAWRVRSDLKRYVGLWKGHNSDSLVGYHLPLKTSGTTGNVSGNTLNDPNADFLAANVVAGDALVVDTGSNQGVYEVASVGGAANLTIVGTWPVKPTVISYRIVKETDWSIHHKYRLVRDPQGEVALLFDAETEPLIRVTYDSTTLPASGTGIVQTLGAGLPAIAWGSFDSENLSQSSWDFVRYGITLSATEMRIVPHHQVLNQWNVMASPERLFTNLAHALTDFKSSSTGQPPRTDPDFLADAGLTALTILNEDTPLVPLTQTYEVRTPYPVEEFVSALNRPEDVLNSDADFTLNDSTKRFRLIVPDDVLYSSIDVIEQPDDGSTDLITPFDDECQPSWGGFRYNKEVCLEYLGAVLPENDSNASTPWELVSDAPANVVASTSSGILTYGTNGVGTKTVYRNNSPLPDAPSLTSEVRFRLKLLNDASGGVGETHVMFGLSAPGMTAALTFVTTPLGERLVLVKDVQNGNILGSATFDYLDGNYHDYRIIRDPGRGVVQVFIDS